MKHSDALQHWCLHICGISGNGKARCFMRVTWLRCNLARSAPSILIECSSAGLNQKLGLSELTAWLAVVFCSPSCSLSFLGSQQRFGWADSPLHYRLLKTNQTIWYLHMNLQITLVICKLTDGPGYKFRARKPSNGRRMSGRPVDYWCVSYLEIFHKKTQELQGTS